MGDATAIKMIGKLRFGRWLSFRGRVGILSSGRRLTPGQGRERGKAMSGTVEREGVVLRVRDIKRSLRDVENIINDLEGEIRWSDVFASGSIISATVDKKNISTLIDKLSKLGELTDHHVGLFPVLKKNYTGEITIILESF